MLYSYKTGLTLANYSAEMIWFHLKNNQLSMEEKNA